MKMTNIICLLTLASLTVLTSACSVTKRPEIIKTFEQTSITKPVTSFLVIGAGDDRAADIKFEKQLTQQLASNGIAAYSAHLSLDKDAQLNKDSVLKLIDELGVKGVLVTRVLARQLQIEELEKRTELIIEKPQFEKLTDVFVYQYKNVQVKRELDISATVYLNTDLYIVADESRAMSFQSTSFDIKDGDTVISDTIEGIIKALHQNNIIE